MLPDLERRRPSYGTGGAVRQRTTPSSILWALPRFGNLSQEVTPEALLSIYGITIADLDAAVKQRLREQQP